MSVIGKLPFVQKIFGNMNGEQLLRLSSLLNNLGQPKFVNLNELSDEDKGVNYVRLVFDELHGVIHYGFLIYIDEDNCGFFSFQDFFEEMKAFDIDPVTLQYTYLQEHLTAEEFRRCLDDYLEVEVPDVKEVVVEDITALTNADCSALHSGDVVLKEDETGRHAYVVSFKKERTGMCLTYTDAENVETVSYDFDGTDWVYNSTDITPISSLNTGSAEVGQVLTVNEQRKAVWSDAGGGLPEAEGAGKVLVGKADGEWEQAKAVPLADNLLANPVNNDAMYSSGPTGGLADISTGEEAYLQEVKGMSIVWNQLLHGDGTDVVPFSSSNILIYYNAIAKTYTLYNGNGYFGSFGLGDKIFDLTLMFGGNDKIPFSLSIETEYPSNGTLPTQSVTAAMRFQRLFANVDLVHAPYDAGTIKNVKATKLVETGRNLWNNSTMKSTGLQLLAGYGYEVYIKQSAQIRRLKISFDNGQTWSDTNLNRYQRADGKYIWHIKKDMNCLIKPVNEEDTFAIEYVGFVHSGNYCLTTGTVNNSSYAYTDTTIPPYVKHEFVIDGIDGLNGLKESGSAGTEWLYDTKDYRRIGSLDLANYANVMTWSDDDSAWVILNADLPQDLDIHNIRFYLTSKGYTVEQYVPEDTEDGIEFLGGDVTSSNKPTGTLLYPLTEPVATGESAFEPIALKSGDNWVVDDMGSEYFVQPSNTNCPVNQVAYYYENLKDKLQNMQIIEVEAIQFDNKANPLGGLKIGDNKYKCFYNNVTTTGTLAIGVSGGPAASVSGIYAVVLGYSAQSTKNFAIAIGAEAGAYQPYVVSFDNNYSTGNNCRTISLFDPNHIHFKNEANSQAFHNYLTDFVKGHFLSEYVQNQTLVLQDGKYYISYTDANNFKTFSNNRVSGTDNDITSTVKGVHLVVKLSNNNVASLDLLPYNSQAFTAYGIASDTPTFVSAYIDADGCVIINAPSGLTVSEALYTLR